QADEGTADRDDRQAARADLVDLAHQLAPEDGGRARGAQHGQREQPAAAERADGFGDRAHAASVRGAVAMTNGIGPSARPSRNWRSSGSSLACRPSGVPSNTIRPLAITTTWSATGSVSWT